MGITVFVIVIIVFVGILSLFRLRKGGPGPSVNWFPKFMRPGVNRRYKEHGWQEPYTDDGERNPDRDDL